MPVLTLFSQIRAFLFCSLLIPTLAFAVAVLPTDDTGPHRKMMQWGADQSTLNRKTHIVELRGNAYVYRDNEEIHADSIDLNNETQSVKAKGRVQYQYGKYYIRADSIDIDLKNKVGTVINGNISNGLFSLRGSRMDQVGENHFLIKDYDYSTCIDCPNSWELTGKNVDLTLEGYAYMTDFVFKIFDSSLIWLPYMIIPLKTKRQSGLLFPRFGTNEVYGLYTVAPYFFAINDWSDMTIGAGYYGSRGPRFEWEGRYALTKRSLGSFNLYWTRDTEINNLYYRYAIKGAVTQEMPLGFEGKLRLNEVSDSGYPITYSDDILGRFEPVITSDLFFSRNDPQVSTVVSLRRIRNLLNFDANNKFVSDFDGNTVQEFPRVVVNSNEQFIFGQKIATGVEARYNRFRRAGGPFDYIVYNGISIPTVREADRFTLIPSIYTTLNPWPWLSLVPSAQYRSFYYTFNSVPQSTSASLQYPNLARGYLLTQAELSLQLEKLYPSSDDPSVSFKHIIRPELTYSRIPTVQQSSDHPFIKQVQAVARPGQYFDSSDIVPFGTIQNLDSYFTPLGNSLTYGLITQVFRKERQKEGDTKVSRRFEAGLTQTLDIREAQRTIAADQADSRVILSPLFTHFIYQDQAFSSTIDYTYYSYLDRYIDNHQANLLTNANPHRFSTSLAWTWERKMKDGILRFERSLGIGYSFSKLTSRVSSLSSTARFSINDYIMPKGELVYNLVQGNTRVLTSTAGFLFQSPSRCWQFDFAYTYSVDRGSGVTGSFALNFDGNSYGSMTR